MWLSEIIMGASWQRIIFESNANKGHHIRRIERDYLLQSIALSQQELIEYQKISLKADIVAAMKLGNLEYIATAVGSNITTQLEKIGGRLDDLSAGVNTLLDLADEQLEAIAELHDFLRESFKRVAALLLEQKAMLEYISNQLSNPYEMQAKELRAEADKWWHAGHLAEGIEQHENYEDAYNLYQEAVKNPIGNQDYYIWFQIAWLLWKHKQSISEAKDAFHRAARLASLSKDAYYSLALRHEGYMHYLLKDYSSAYNSCKRATDYSKDASCIYDLARYSAKLDYQDKAISLLRSAITKEPSLIVTMFSEVDFLD